MKSVTTAAVAAMVAFGAAAVSAWADAEQGTTVEEARANLKEAVDLYIESFGDQGLPEGK